MKKIIVSILLLASPTLAFAQGFDTNVRYGMKGDSVLEMQEFLGAHGYFAGPYTGNFYALTLAAVKRFQAAESIPTTGFFGPLSRLAAQRIIASENADDEVSTTTQNVPAPQLQSGTINPMNPAPAAPQNNQPQAPAVSQAPNTPAAPAAPAQDAPAFVPFVRSGSASASLTSSVTTLPMNGGRIYLVTLAIKNDTNETLSLADLGVPESSFFAVSNNTIANWQPRLVGIYRNTEFREDRRGIKPGETAEVKFILDTYPTEKGSFDLSIPSMKLIGQQTGSFVELGGFPLSLGTFTIVE